MESAAEAKSKLAGPAEATLPAKEAVAPARIKAPDQRTLEEKVVPTPGLMVRLWRVCGMRMDPPDALTRTREPSATKLPAEVSMERIVIVLPFASRTPPLPTVSVSVVRERFEAEVLSVVVPAPPWTVRVWAVRPEPAVVKVTVLEPPLKTTALNSSPPRFPPANVMVCDVLAVNVTVPDPADQEAEVDAFVQAPDTVQASEPKAMYEAAAEMSTSPEIATLPDAEVR